LKREDASLRPPFGLAIHGLSANDIGQAIVNPDDVKHLARGSARVYGYVAIDRLQSLSLFTIDDP
jgi:hypothetical protein